MMNNDDIRESAEDARERLLQRLLGTPRIGALLKGLGVFVKDCSAGVCIPNTLWKELGYSAADMRGNRWKRFVHPEESHLVDEFYDRLMSGEADTWEGEFRLKATDGKYRRVRHKSVVLERNEQGVPTLYVGWDVDITDDIAKLEEANAARDREERRFLQSETIRTAGAILSSELDPVRAAERVLAQASQVIPFITAAVWTLDGDRLIRLASRGEQTGDTSRLETFSDAELLSILGMSVPRVSTHPLDRFPAKLEIPLIVRGEVHGLLEFRSCDCGGFGPDVIALAVQFADHAVVALANALRYRATEIEAATDWLTGLPTRRAFMSRATRLKDAIKVSDPVSALMVDIDHFKQVNDSYGHSAGDCVLSLIAKTCRDSLRSHDLSCRYGGE